MLERDVCYKLHNWSMLILLLSISSQTRIKSYRNTNFLETRQYIFRRPETRVDLDHRRAVETVEEVGAGAEQVEAGAGVEGQAMVAMRGSEHGRTRTKLAEETTIGKGDTIRRWPELAHLDTRRVLVYT